MTTYAPHDSATSSVLALASHGVEPGAEEDTAADVDEPPELQTSKTTLSLGMPFEKTMIRRKSEQHQSLLTQALQSQSEDEQHHETGPSRRRRSVNSNMSSASTAELTNETAVTTPARTSSPSPRQLPVRFTPIAGYVDVNHVSSLLSKHESPRPGTKCEQPTTEAAGEVKSTEKKRCISFACLAQPVKDKAGTMPPPPKPVVEPSKPVGQEPPPQRRTCIKFANSARPCQQSTPPQKDDSVTRPAKVSTAQGKDVSPATVVRFRSSFRSPSAKSERRASTPLRSSNSPATSKSKKFWTDNTSNLDRESSRFHEFASDGPQEDDWIREDKDATRRKLTIDDTLKKELAIRKLGKEAEEEAEQEDEDDEDNIEAGASPLDDEDDAEGDDDEEEDGDELEEPDDDVSGYGSDDDISDGYKTDTEVGFASSDEEDDDLVLWTSGQIGHLNLSGATPVFRRPSYDGHSDSSAISGRHGRFGKPKSKRMPIYNRPATPELPDSTDFVCGTLDEDRPLEEAYLSCMAARKREKLHVIPQDIDPSFPASDPEDDGEENGSVKQARNDSDEAHWFHGEFEDLHHEQDRTDRRVKKAGSPKRYRSPPPKRHHSPPPKARGRSPRRLFDRQSPPPRRIRSPAPLLAPSPVASPVEAKNGIAFKALAFRPGLTQTKSLPRPPAVFPQMKPHRRTRANTHNKKKHVRGAIDIVKGLEEKRQRRKEKFHAKYCDRARKGMIHEKRTQPGKGAERMKEIGLLMAGKTDRGNYVISF